MSADDLESFSQIQELQATNIRLMKQLTKKTQNTEELVAAVYLAAKDAALATGSASPVKAPAKDRRQGKTEIAVLHATDWQGGKRTRSYNSDVMNVRLEQFCDKVERLTSIQRSHHPVEEAHILLGGDMLENTQTFPHQVWEVDMTLFAQIFHVALALENFVRRQLALFQTVHVWEEYGNHGRIGMKNSGLPASDNFDRMIYRIVADKFAGEKRVHWHPIESWYNLVTIGNYSAMLVHGDEIKSFGGNTPAFGILRKCNAWASGVVEHFNDVYIGHYHTPMTLAMANGGRIFMTGSTESDNEFAREFVAATGKPSQRLNFVDPEKGRVTAEYVVWLD